MEKHQKTGNRRISVSEQKICMAMGVYPGKTKKEVKELLESELTKYLVFVLPFSIMLFLGAVLLFVTKT